jgi:hypothetical protein
MENYPLIRTTHRGVYVKFRYVLVAAGLLGAGILVGAGTVPPSEARGEVRVDPPPKSFETGGQLSVPILRDIATTLHQMDARLAHVETVAKQLQAQLLLDQRTQ